MRRLAIMGASGHGKCLADVALLLGYTDILFFDDVWPNKTLNGAWSVVGSMQDLLESLHDFDSVIVGIGNNTIRMRKQASLLAVNAPLTTLPHPASTLSSFARYGAGSVFLAGTVVNVDTVLGDAVIVNTGATIDHDCLLADGVHIAPGAHLSGGVHVGARSWIGIGACVKQGICIGSDVTVGAGSVVISDIPDGVTVAGNPARTL